MSTAPVVLKTDLNIVQLPATLPNFGGLLGKNLIQVDPNFGTSIVRVTDASDANNQSMQTSDTGASIIWNKNDTMLLCRSTGGSSFLFQFNPNKMQATNLNTKFRNPVCFSMKQPGVLFSLVDQHILTKVTYKFVKGVWTAPTSVVLCDFATALPPGFKITWTGSWIPCLDDSTFMMGFSEGVQNTAFLCVVWRKGKGFRVLNTQTGEITGSWGALGTGTVSSPDPTTKFPFVMHECSMSPNPSFGNVGLSKAGDLTGGHLFWELDTLNFRDCVVSGHAAKGYLHNYAGGPGGGQHKEVLYSDPTQVRLVVPANLLPANQVPPQHYDGDCHYGFGKIDLLDNATFWMSSKAKDVNGTPALPFTSCWMNEVRGMEAQTGIVHRACHTFNSGLSKEFIVAYAIAVPSATAKFVAFTSDMMGTLGSTSGAAQGTLGVDARGDVFVVKIA